MQLNLKTGILTLVAAISLVACSESYPGMLYDESGNKATNTEGLDSANLVPLYVYVNKQSFFTVTATPGNGQLPSGVTRGIGSFQPITSSTDEQGQPIIYSEEDSIRYFQTNFRLFAFRDGRYATTGSAYPAELANVTNLDLFGYMDQHMINEFNHSQNKYRIVPCEFDAEFDSKESYNKQLLDQLNLSIASGKAPDLVCYIPLSVQLNLQNKGVFTDLYPLMDKDDKVNRDTVMPNLQKAMETSDGKLYCMPMGFDIATLLTKTSICDKENWTFQDMLDLYDNAPASADHLYDCYGKDEIMWRMRYVIEDFIDTEKATTNFDSPEFIKLLEFCNRFADTGVEGNKDSMMEYEAYITDKESWLKNDRIYLWEQNLSMPSDYNFTKSYFADNADMTFVGYPSSNGKGGRIVPSMTMAITETCQDKEGAWEFIKFCLDQTNTVDSDGLTCCGLPVLREAYENYLDSEMHSEHTASGNPIPSLSQEDRDFLSDYILSCDTMGSMADDDVINICAEEAGEYFAGERSAEETAQIIQSRVSILISERS